MEPPTSRIPADIAVLLQRDGVKWPEELNWARQAKYQAEQARRLARIAANSSSISIGSPRGSPRTLPKVASSPSPRKSSPRGLAPLKLSARDVASREAHVARARTHQLLDEMQRSPFSAAGLKTILAPAPSTAAAPLKPRPVLSSPRVPCVQAGHRQILEGRFADAETPYRDALARKEAALGPTNPSTLSSVISLADLLALQGRHAEAIPLFKRALQARAVALGAGHALSKKVAWRLTRALRSIEREEEALAVEARFGPEPEQIVDVGDAERAVADALMMQLKVKVGPDGAIALTVCQSPR